MSSNFVFLPLGGCDEVGVNLNLYGCDGKWLIVDCGISFSDHLGIEIVMPKIDYIEERRNDLVGIVVTHAHEDHIGALPYLWHRLRCPIYASPFTAEVLRTKFKETPFAKSIPIIEVKPSQSVDLHPFHLDFINLTHSIPEPQAIAIRTQYGTAVHTGDWKFDPNPLIGDVSDVNKLKMIGDEGVLALVCDSTNIFNQGASGSEKTVRENLITIIQKYPKHRIVMACFASNVARLETAAIAARESGRQVVLVGRSLERMEATARYAGYLKGVPKFLSDQQGKSLDPQKTLLLCTGSQGEHKSALARIARGDHPFIKLDAGDLVLFSARTIPGNEKHVGHIQNQLTRHGALIITASEEEIHVSGHPHQDELKEMYRLLRPKTLIPVHGEARHLFAHRDFALKCGVPHTLIPNNGTVIQLAPGQPKVIEEGIPVGRIVMDGKRTIDQDSMILKQRNKLAINGLIVASIRLSAKKTLKHRPSFTVLGLTDAGEETELFKEALFEQIQKISFNEYSSENGFVDAIKQAIRRTAHLRFGKKPVTEIHLLCD